MNVFVGSGMFYSARFANDGKILKFILIDEREGKANNEIPCLIFNPDEEMKGLFAKERVIEFQGKVQNFSYEVAGEKVSRTEVIVNTRSIRVIR